jgi:hypothetical protein
MGGFAAFASGELLASESYEAPAATPKAPIAAA